MSEQTRDIRDTDLDMDAENDIEFSYDDLDEWEDDWEELPAPKLDEDDDINIEEYFQEDD